MRCRGSAEKDELEHRLAENTPSLAIRGMLRNTERPRRQVGLERRGRNVLRVRKTRSVAHSAGDTMYRVVYWTGVTVLVAWSVFSAYSAFNGL
jgi:hypothetical protein